MSFTRLARREKAESRAVADDTLGTGFKMRATAPTTISLPRRVRPEGGATMGVYGEDY